MSKKLPARTIVVGRGEKYKTIRVTDQKTLRELQEIIDLIPARD
jgi:hypothetical protein